MKLHETGIKSSMLKYYKPNFLETLLRKATNNDYHYAGFSKLELTHFSSFS